MKKQRFEVRLSEEEATMFRQLASEKGLSVSEMLRNLVYWEWLKDHELTELKGEKQ